MNKRAKQSGYVLPLVLIILTLLMMGSIRFTDFSVASMKLSGENQHSSAALLLAESAMNKLLGEFSSGGDTNGDGVPDINQALQFDQANGTPSIPLPYVFFRSAGNGVDQTQPGLLQRVANGEARPSSASSLQTQVASADQNYRINGLSGDGFGPNIYQPNATGLAQVNSQWSSLQSFPGRAAAWLEVVNPNPNSGRFHVYVQAAAQVGSARSYVQRFAGTFRNTLGRNISTLTEANPTANGS